MQKLFFVSSNKSKYDEMREMLNTFGYELEFVKKSIDELQTSDIEKLVRDKVIKAFKIVKRPVIVEHTMLCIDAFNTLPGTNTSEFFTKMGSERICRYCCSENVMSASTHSILGYCDGMTIKIIDKEQKGSITDKYSKNMDTKNVFDWDDIFIPECKENSEHKTMHALNGLKNKISMRRRAVEELCDLLDRKPINEPLNEYEQYIDKMAHLIKEKKLILFVGAGISNCVKLPTWNVLIKELGKDLGYDGEIFELYGDYLTLAEYYRNEKNDDELQKKLVQTFTADENEIKNSEIYNLIAELNVPVIYTTNYDENLEKLYKIKKIPFSLISTTADIRNVQDSTTRIVKFHGALNQKETIVLSERQYFDRMDFDSLLDIQLQYDWARYNVLYLGYSLSDINIKLMLYRSEKKRTGLDGKELESFIFTATPNEIQAKVFKLNNIIAVHNDIVDKQESTKKFLEDLVLKVKNLS